MDVTCDNTTTETMPQYTKPHLHIASLHADPYTNNKWQSKFMPDANFNGHPKMEMRNRKSKFIPWNSAANIKLFICRQLTNHNHQSLSLSFSIRRIHSDIYFSIIIYDNLGFRSGTSYARRFQCSDAVDNKWQWMQSACDWIVYIFSLLSTHWTGNTCATKCKCQSTIRAHSIQMTCINRTPGHSLFYLFLLEVTVCVSGDSYTDGVVTMTSTATAVHIYGACYRDAT